jgi:hypothetical protein
MSEADIADLLQVRVWFGEHAIAHYSGDTASALRYAAAMRRRFPSLQVSTEPLRQSFAQR